MKTNKQLLSIWEEKEKQTIKGELDFENLTLTEKSRLFDLIKKAKHKEVIR